MTQTDDMTETQGSDGGTGSAEEEVRVARLLPMMTMALTW